MATKKRLTKGLVATLVNKIIDDVPQVDYESKIQDYFNKRAFDELPEVLKCEVAKEYLEDKYLFSIGVKVRNAKFKPTLLDSAFVAEQTELDRQQSEKIRAIRASLREQFEKCFYVETFTEQFPEFAKYLPKDEAPIINLPTIQIKETLAALGWPKSDEGK